MISYLVTKKFKKPVFISLLVAQSDKKSGKSLTFRSHLRKLMADAAIRALI